jgi:hypothetical protein
MYLFTRKFELHSCQTESYNPLRAPDRNGQPYILTVTLSGPINPNGIIIRYDIIDNLLNSQFAEKFQSDPDWFATNVPHPTLENIADFIFTKLENYIAGSAYAGVLVLQSITITPKREPDLIIERRRD